MHLQRAEARATRSAVNKPVVFACIVALPYIVLAAVACSETTLEPGADSGTDARPDRSKDSGRISDEDSSDDDEEPRPDDEKDGGKDSGDCTGTPSAPDLAGSQACGAIDFGMPAAAFTGVDAGDDSEMTGGAIPPGIYDLIGAERLSGTSGSWRETIVFGGGRFTRIRQIGAAGLGPVTYRSGAFSTSGNELTFTEDCYVNGATPADAGTTTLPYKVNTDACGTTSLQYTATAFRFTLVPRKD